jgi:FHA domain
MATKRGTEQDIATNRQTIARLDQQIREVKAFIATNEQTWQNSSEPLRTITQEGLTKARANLAQQEIELQQAHSDLARNEKVAAALGSIETLQQYIDKYAELLEKARSDLTAKEQELLELTSPVRVPAYELLVPAGGRAVLPTDRSQLLVGCRDEAAQIYPDIDLTPFGGQGSGASRRHARLAFSGGRWTLTDLESVNGTFVDEQRLAANVPLPLPERAQIRFGKIAFTFQPVQSNRTMRLS